MQENNILDTIFDSEEQKEKFLDEIFKEMVKRGKDEYKRTGLKTFGKLE